MNDITKTSLIHCLIIYLILLIPGIISCFIKINKNKYDILIIINVLLNSILSFIFFNNIEFIFNLFNSSSGITNYSIYAAKIIFIFSPIMSLKILLPTFLYKQTHNKNYFLLLISKELISITISKIFFFVPISKYALFIFPLTDLIFQSYIIAIYFIHKLTTKKASIK